MSDYIIHSRLETLPNEILSDVFSYFHDPIDLLNSFYGLNQRFNTLLSSYPVIKLFVVEEDKLKDACMEFFLPRTRSLYLRVNWLSTEQVLTQFYPVERLVNLEHLRLSSKAHFHTVLYELIFSNFFPSLRRCNLGSVESSWNWLGSPALTTVCLALGDPGNVRMRSGCLPQFKIA